MERRSHASSTRVGLLLSVNHFLFSCRDRKVNEYQAVLIWWRQFSSFNQTCGHRYVSICYLLNRRRCVFIFFTWFQSTHIHHFFGLGNVVVLKVIRNPGRLGLGKSTIQQAFGEKSKFSCALTILRIQPNRADLKMESCSGKVVLDCK